MTVAEVADLAPIAAKPRYLQLADELRESIYSGRLIAGSQFPTENELCKSHGVSRYTVREALRRLEGEGLISRRRGSGTSIKPAAARGGTLHQPLSNLGEILQYARDTHIRYTREGKTLLPRKMIERIGGEGCEGDWIRFRGVRERAGDDRPIAVTDAYVHNSLSSAVEQLNLEGETLFRQLEKLSGVDVSRITQDIQAVPASAEIAQALRIPRRAPCLLILRCYYDVNDRLFEISASHHPGDRFAYSMRIDVEK